MTTLGPQTHSAMNSLEPTNTDPTGADKPLLKQIETESKSRQMRSTLTPRAAAALNTLAPSMWRAMRAEPVPTPGLRTRAASSSRKASGTLPPHILWVFSTTTIEVMGSCWSSCRIRRRSSSRLNVPSCAFFSVANWTPARCEAPPKGD